MSSLREYLIQKRDALLARRAKAKTERAGPHQIAANVKAEGRSGVRRIRIRDHQILSDSPSGFAGYDFGPASPELQLGVLGSCLTHIFLLPIESSKRAASRTDAQLIPIDQKVVGAWQEQVDYFHGLGQFKDDYKASDIVAPGFDAIISDETSKLGAAH
jgi:hypothetical protein